MTEVPRDIRTGEPLFSETLWNRMSESEKAICCYHNSPHRQRMTELYAHIRSQAKGDDG